MRTATYATSIGKGVSFALTAFRQAFAGGRDLSVADNVMIAAAACELHPNAVARAVEQQTVKDALKAATEEALGRGVVGVPSIAAGDQVFWGDDRLSEAARALR
jgi:2-hydroxychromene-2-carboxylate isomerase